MKTNLFILRMLFCLGLSLGASCAITGCEDNSDDSDTNAVAATETNSTSEAESDTSDTTSDEYFPDGLHPNSSGDSTIASVFASYISPGQSAGDNDPNTVVCLGDSITEDGYPSYLAGDTGMAVVDEGTGGEKSSGGASRVSGVLNTYKPAYLCILYGANDVINGVSASVTIANLQAIINAAKNNNTIPIIGTLTPMSGKYADHNDAAQELSSSIRSLASSSGIACADLERAF